jgi:hypothetical protein
MLFKVENVTKWVNIVSSVVIFIVVPRVSIWEAFFIKALRLQMAAPAPCLLAALQKADASYCGRDCRNCSDTEFLIVSE